MSDKKRILKNSIIVTIATLIEKVIFFTINVIVARYLSVELYGEYTTALGYATFFSIFTNIGIDQSLIRAINLESQYENEHFTNNLIIKTFLAVGIYIILVISLSFTNYNPNTIYLTLIFGIVRIGNEYLISFYALNDAKEKFKVQAIVTSLFSLSLLASTVIIILLDGGYFHFAYVRALLVIFFLAAILYHTLKNFTFRFNFETLKSYIKTTIPFSFGIIFNNVISHSNLIILSLFHGTIYSGIYNNGSIFISTLSFIPRNFTKILLPFLYKIPYLKNKNKYQFTYDVFSKLFNIISFLIVLNILCFAKEIIFIIFGEKYNDSIIILKIISIALLFMFSIAPTIIVSLDRQDIVTRHIGIAAVVNVVFNIVLIKFLKSEGAAIAAVLTYIIYFVLNHIYIAKNNIVNIKASLLTFLKISLISVSIYLIHFYYLSDIFWIFNLFIINILFAILILIFLISKNDIRILRETILK